LAGFLDVFFQNNKGRPDYATGILKLSFMFQVFITGYLTRNFWRARAQARVHPLLDLAIGKITLTRGFITIRKKTDPQV